LGTCAYGALIIAIIKMLQVMVEYVDQKSKEMGEDPPAWFKAIICFCRCFLCCLEMCMRFLNKNAYILTCINGTWFCASACHAAAVLFSKIDYVFITVTITSGMLVFGKIGIAVATAAIGAYWCGQMEVSSIVAPAILILIVAYTIAMLFCEVYEMGIDTVLMCYLEAEHAKIPADQLPIGIRQFVEDSETQHWQDEADKKAERQEQIRKLQAADTGAAPGTATEMPASA